MRLMSLQKHVLPLKVTDWKSEDMEWFFNSGQGVIGIDGKSKLNPKVTV